MSKNNKQKKLSEAFNLDDLDGPFKLLKMLEVECPLTGRFFNAIYVHETELTTHLAVGYRDKDSELHINVQRYSPKNIMRISNYLFQCHLETARVERAIIKEFDMEIGDEND